VGIWSFNSDISAYWRTRNSSESPHKSPHSLRRANDNQETLDFCPPSCLAPPLGYIWRKTRTNDRTPSKWVLKKAQIFEGILLEAGELNRPLDSHSVTGKVLDSSCKINNFFRFSLT
jgi:hypothetical protein